MNTTRLIGAVNHAIHDLDRRYIFILAMFFIHIYLRLFELESRLTFAIDQINNSWVMKNMLVDGKFPLLGMVAKLQSGFHIGPGYFYLLAPFYWLFKLDPIASEIFAAVISGITFWILFFVTRKIFSLNIALISVFLYAVSVYTITSDRIAWPVILIPITSLLSFYFLYQVLTIDTKYLLPLAAVVGFAYHVHFTVVFYIFIVLCCLPFFPYRKKSIFHILVALLIFFVWLTPNIFAEFSSGFRDTYSLAHYSASYFQGFHLVRFIQLTNDAFIQFENVLFFKQLKYLGEALFLLFILRCVRRYNGRKGFVFAGLSALWFLVPWFTLSLYGGEISAYYFTITLPLCVIITAFLTDQLLSLHRAPLSLGLIGFGIYYGVTNITYFAKQNNTDFSLHRFEAIRALKEGRTIKFKEGDAEAYLFYVYARNKKTKYFNEK